MKKLTVIAVGIALLVPSLAFADSFSLRVGYFMPRALSPSYIAQNDNTLWAIEFNQMSLRFQDFRGWTIGAGYEYFLGKYVSLVLAVDTFKEQKFADYLDYDQTEFEEGWFAFPIDSEPGDIGDWYYISHSFRVASTPLMASVKISPLGRKTRLIPYFGGGIGAYFWSAGIFGEMVDFSDEWVYADPVLGDIPVYPVISVNTRERGTAMGYHAFAGLQFPLGYRATIDAEARYHWAKGRFNDGLFVDFDDFDLGGLAVTLGFTYWF
jgi:opacity protein-like surface antigen